MAAPSPTEALDQPTPRRLGALGLALLVTGVLVVATVGTALAWRARVEDDERRAFATEAAQVERRVASSVERIDEAVGDVALASAEQPLTATSFADPVLRSLPPDLPASVATVAVVEAVPAADLEPFVAERRDDGLVDFQVRSPSDGEVHLVATYEQSGGPRPLLDGLDLAGIDAATAALDEAAASGTPATSAVLGELPTSGESLLRSGFLVVQPTDVEASAPGGASVDVLDRWVVALVDGEQLLQAALEGTRPGVEVSLEGAGGDLLATTAIEGDRAIELGALDDDDLEVSALERPGGSLELAVAQLRDEGGGASVTEPMVVLLVGGLISVMVGALVWALARTRAGAFALAEAATSNLQRSEEQFRTVVQNLSDIVLLLDEAGTVRYASPSVRTLLGWSSSEVVGTSVFDGMHPGDETAVREAMVDAGLRRPGLPAGARRLLEVRMRHDDGRFRDFEATVSDTAGASEVGGLVLTAHDVSHRIAAEERLAYDATHDPLTRLPNRTLLDDRLSHALERSTRTGADVAVLFLDLDGFKAVNDTWGHAAGDRVLREVAGRVAATARASDTVARIGGDEFVVVCEEAGSLDGAQTLARRILHALEVPIEASGASHHVGVSVGIAVAGSGQRDAADLLRRADEAMYRAKQAGRGRIEVDTSSAGEATGGADTAPGSG